jgi:hypothetical protein
MSDDGGTVGRVECEGKDLFRPVSQLPDGSTIVSRHRPDHTVETTLAVPTVAGKTMSDGDEFVTLKNLGNGLFEIVDSYVHGERQSGPAQVSTDEYRCGWERTWGGKAS